MTFLADILKRKREEVDARRARTSFDHLKAQIREREAPRDLFAALSPRGGPMRVIAEIKRASPSVGTIDPTVDAPKLAQTYAGAGAAAISVLTDGPGFGGSLDDLAAVRAGVNVPLLRKDFIVDRYQLFEGRAYGADAVLLIVAALDDERLLRLHAEAAELGLAVIVEVHDQRELDRALAAGALIVGVNNRDLKTFKVDLSVSESLIAQISPGTCAIAESGIKGVDDAKRLRAAGAANLLVGEALVRARSAAELIAELTGIA